MFELKQKGDHPAWLIKAYDAYVASIRGTRLDYAESIIVQRSFEQELGIKLNYGAAMKSGYTPLESVTFEDEAAATMFLLRWS